MTEVANFAPWPRPRSSQLHFIALRHVRENFSSRNPLSDKAFSAPPRQRTGIYSSGCTSNADFFVRAPGDPKSEEGWGTLRQIRLRRRSRSPAQVSFPRIDQKTAETWNRAVEAAIRAFVKRALVD